MRFVENVVAAADVVEAAFPKYQHFINAGKYNKELAKKHLLMNPCRTTLPTTLASLWSKIAALSKLHVHWGMSPTMVEDHAIVDVLGRAQNVLDHGRDTLNVIAAASIVQELTASEQHTKALADAEPPSKKQKVT